MKLDDVMELLDESIQYYREVAEEYMQGCLHEQRMGRDGDFFYQCYMVNSGRADGLMEFRAEVEEMMEGKGFDETEFLKEFTREA